MFDFSKSCIFCNKSEDLDTTMDVKINNDKYKVSICKLDEEKAIPSLIKETVSKKLDEFKKLQDAAAALGFHLTSNTAPANSIVIPVADENQQHKVVSQVARQSPTIQLGPQENMDPTKFTKVEVKPGVVMSVQRNNRINENLEVAKLSEEKSRLDRQAEIESQSVETYARPSSSEAPRFASLNLPDSVRLKSGKEVNRPRTTAIEHQVVRGRAGVPTTIPATMAGDSGKTIINHVNINERDLERRWKQEADISRGAQRPDQMPANLTALYLPECLMCNGTGVSKMNKKQMCIKCGGSGHRS